MEEVGFAQSIGIYAFNGPTWETDAQTLCDNNNVSEDSCEDYKDYDGSETAVAAKNNDHWT